MSEFFYFTEMTQLTAGTGVRLACVRDLGSGLVLDYTVSWLVGFNFRVRVDLGLDFRVMVRIGFKVTVLHCRKSM